MFVDVPVSIKVDAYDAAFEAWWKKEKIDFLPNSDNHTLALVKSAAKLGWSQFRRHLLCID